MTGLLTTRRPPATGPDTTPGRHRSGALTSGWVAAGSLLAVIATVLHHYGTPAGDLVAFGGHLALAVTLPGTLLWRALRGRPGHIAEDLAAGTAVGYALEVLTYLPARGLGWPLLFLAWPITALAAFTTVPRLRRHWRGSGLRAPAWWTWTTSAFIGLIVLSSGARLFQGYRIGPPWHLRAEAHLTFHLALIGELKHHMPPMVPWVHGEPLHYHWFVCADMAAVSWATGIEPLTLLYRLSVPPMIVVSILLLTAVTRRVTGAWWTGPTALVLCYLTVSPLAAGQATLVDNLLLAQSSMFLWFGPSQPFGALLFAAAMLVVIDLVRRQGRATDWGLAGVLLVAVMGAKAVYLPLLLAGLVTALAVRLVLHRTVDRPVVLLTGGVLVLLTFAQLVLFGGATQGLRVEPGKTLRFLAFYLLPGAGRDHGALVLLLVALLLGWSCAWAGVAGLLRRPRVLLDPALCLFLGIGVAGVVAMFAFFQGGLSQVYFARGGNPYLAVAAVCGLASALPGRLTRRRVLGLAAALACGTGLGIAHRSFVPLVALPIVVAGGLCVAGILAAATGRRGERRSLTVATAVVLATALTVPATVGRVREIVLTALPGGGGANTEAAWITRGTFAAARWLRRHSDPDTLVATNAHCSPPTVTTCREHLHMWVSALTERRVLVEGWSFTGSANARSRAGTEAGSLLEAPFWDQKRLAANDAAFRTPSAETIGRLRDGYGVRWLFADDRVPRLAHDLGRHAVLRFRRQHCSVYELTGAAGTGSRTAGTVS